MVCEFLHCNNCGNFFFQKWNEKNNALALEDDVTSATTTTAKVVNGEVDFAISLGVPQVYFSAKFNVADVCSDEDTLNPFLQQKFSHYLDMVEMELVKQVREVSEGLISQSLIPHSLLIDFPTVSIFFCCSHSNTGIACSSFACSTANSSYP